MTGYTARSRRGTAEAVRSALHDFFRRVDPVLLVCTLVLTGLGLLTIWGAVDNFGQRKLKMQFAMAVLGIIMTFVVANLDYHIILERLWLPFLIFSVGILALTLVAGSTGEGIETSNKSWLTVPVVGIAIQPSEFVKITFICTYSRHLALVQSRIRSPRVLPWLAVHALLIVGLILLSGDLGVALVYIAMILLLLFCAGLPLWWFGGGALAGAVALPFLWNRLQPYQQERILVGFNPELDPLDKAICDFVDCLKPGGRMLVITFHSLEDRLVKRCFQRLQNPCTCPPKAPICTCGKKPVVKVLAHGAAAPTEEEVDRNPRARSAKLRVAQKLEVL